MKNTTFVIFSVLLLGLGFYANKFQVLSLILNTFRHGNPVLAPLETKTDNVETEFNLGKIKQLGELGSTSISLEVIISLKKKSLFSDVMGISTDFVFYAQGDVVSNINLADLTDKSMTVYDDLIELRLPPPRITNISFQMGKSEVPALQKEAETQAFDKIARKVCTDGIFEKAIASASDELAQILPMIQSKPVRIIKPRVDLKECIRIVSAQPKN